RVIAVGPASEWLMVHCRHDRDAVSQRADWLQLGGGFPDVASRLKQLGDTPLDSAGHPRSRTERIELSGYITIERARESETSAQTNVDQVLHCPKCWRRSTYRTRNPNVGNGEPQ